MVDSVSGIGNASNVTSITKPKQTQNAAELKPSVEPQDKVEISTEALNLAQAEEKAVQTRELLKNSDFSLGLNPNFDEKV